MSALYTLRTFKGAAGTSLNKQQLGDFLARLQVLALRGPAVLKAEVTFEDGTVMTFEQEKPREK